MLFKRKPKEKEKIAGRKPASKKGGTKLTAKKTGVKKPTPQKKAGKTATRKPLPRKKVGQVARKNASVKPQKRAVAHKNGAAKKTDNKSGLRLMCKKNGCEIAELTKKMPKGWCIIDGATTAPLGTKWVTNGESHFNGKRKQKLLITDKKLFRENLEKKNPRYEVISTKVRAGEFATINSASARGHKGEIAQRKKNGQITAITITHAKKTNGRKNIPLQVNPQKGDSRKAYINKRIHTVKEKEIGKRHPDMKIKNPTDKSVIRKIKTNAKKRK